MIFNKLDNYFVVSADRQVFLGLEMTANLRDTSPLNFGQGNICLLYYFIRGLISKEIVVLCR